MIVTIAEQFTSDPSDHMETKLYSLPNAKVKLWPQSMLEKLLKSRTASSLPSFAKPSVENVEKQSIILQVIL